MKIIIAAIALAIAFPAAAQTAPATPEHHGQHQPGQHGQQGHDQHQPGHPQGHEDGCCADRNNNGRMDCCENMAQGAERTTDPAQPQPQGHQNH